jgi:hypothetical protein
MLCDRLKFKRKVNYPHYVELVKAQVQVLLSMMDVVFGIDGCIDTMKG